MVSSCVAFHMPNSATSCSASGIGDGVLWQSLDMGDGVTPVSFAFPTPLQYKPPANTKACVLAATTAIELTAMNAVGFYGG